MWGGPMLRSSGLDNKHPLPPEFLVQAFYLCMYSTHIAHYPILNGHSSDKTDDYYSI